MDNNEKHATQFFDQLEEFSNRYVLDELNLRRSLSPWGKSTLEPQGAILHFTADEDIHRVLRWFLEKRHGARVSAHAVIADRRMGSHDSLAADLPLVQELPTTIIQVRRADTEAWHATWANGVCYGIENVNAGPLKMKTSVVRGRPEVVFSTWRPRDRSSPEWTSRWSSSYKEATLLHGKWWAPYTAAQIRSNVILLRYVEQRFRSLRRAWILGHEQVQKNKQDPGPAFPLEGIREAMFDDWTPIQRYDWYRLYEVDPKYGKTMADGIILECVRKMGTDNPNPSVFSAWTRFWSAVKALPVKAEFGVVGKTALRLLGYYMQSLDDSLDTDELNSVWLFQKMMGLRTDSKPGPITKGALLERLASRGLMDGKAEESTS